MCSEYRRPRCAWSRGGVCAWHAHHARPVSGQLADARSSLHSAANALDEARREAMIHGKARREHIRRHVNELKTIEACEAGRGEHGIVSVGDESSPPRGK